MGFDDSGYVVRRAPLFPVMSGFPDISQVRKFSEDDSFFVTIKEHFNNLMESQKWIKERETQAGAFGYENLELDPDLDADNFVKEAEKKEKIRDEEAEGKPKTQSSSNPTFAEAGVDRQNFVPMADKMKGSLSKVLSTLKYMNEKTDELDSKWSYHNAYMITSVGLFAHEDEFFANLEVALGKLNGIVEGIDDDDDGKDKFVEKLEALKEIRDQLKNQVAEAGEKNLKKEYLFREASNLSAIAVANVSSSGSHKRLVEFIEMENKDAQRAEEDIKKKQMERKAENKREEKKLEKISEQRHAAEIRAANKPKAKKA